MENQAEKIETFQFIVYDEMDCNVLLSTNNIKEAHDVAYNHQCVLIDNTTKKVLHDYSC